MWTKGKKISMTSSSRHPSNSSNEDLDGRKKIRVVRFRLALNKPMVTILYYIIFYFIYLFLKKGKFRLKLSLLSRYIDSTPGIRTNSQWTENS